MRIGHSCTSGGVGTVGAVVDGRGRRWRVRAAELAPSIGDRPPRRPRALAPGGRPAGRDRPWPASPRSSATCSRAGHERRSPPAPGCPLHAARPSAAALVERALRGHVRPLVGDPACGGGALLLAASRASRAAEATIRARRRGRLCGADIDPLGRRDDRGRAVAVGRCPPTARAPGRGRRAARRPRVAAARRGGRQPAVPQPARRATRPAVPDRPPALRDRFGDAVRAYTDTAALFLLRACDLAAPGGTVALLQPQSVLGARDAAGVRGGGRGAGHGGGDVVPDRPGLRRGGGRVCVRSSASGARRRHRWSAHLARAPGVPAVELGGEVASATRRTTTAGFRASSTAWPPHVHEQADLPDGRPHRHDRAGRPRRVAWGERPARIGRPHVEASGGRRRTRSMAARRAGCERTGRPKLHRRHADACDRGRRRRSGRLVPGRAADRRARAGRATAGRWPPPSPRRR